MIVVVCLQPWRRRRKRDGDGAGWSGDVMEVVWLRQRHRQTGASTSTSTKQEPGVSLGERAHALYRPTTSVEHRWFHGLCPRPRVPKPMSLRSMLLARVTTRAQRGA